MTLQHTSTKQAVDVSPTAVDALDVQAQQGSTGSDTSAPKAEDCSDSLGHQQGSDGQLEAWSGMSSRSSPSHSSSGRALAIPL